MEKYIHLWREFRNLWRILLIWKKRGIILITCFHFPILCCRPIRNYTLHLKKLIWLIPTNDGKSKTHVAFLKSCAEESPLQLWCITGEEWFFYISQHKQERQKFWSSPTQQGQQITISAGSRWQCMKTEEIKSAGIPGKNIHIYIY